MTGLVWTKKLSVGNEIIDAEHRNLIGLANDVVHAIKERDGSALAQAFELLESWLRAHLANEEKIALAVNYDFSGHRPAQQYLLKKLRLMRDELIDLNGMWPDSVVEHSSRTLKEWLVEGHIVNLGMLMRSALQTRDYSFCPERCNDEICHVDMTDYGAVTADSHPVAMKKTHFSLFTKPFTALMQRYANDFSNIHLI